MKIPHFERLAAELSPLMTQLECERVVEFLNTLTQSRIETNWTIDDAASQMRILIGSERYQQLKTEWSIRNQPLITNGQRKYRDRQGRLWDGLDEEDDPREYEIIYL